MKRRQGIYNIYSISKKNENKDSKKESSKEQEEKEKEENVIKISPIMQNILNFESSFTGIILMIVIGSLSLIFYDLKSAAIPGKYDIICITITFFLSLYHIFDLVFRNIYFEKSVGSFYFKVQVVAVISLVFDFNLALFLLLKFIISLINKKNKYLSSYNLQLIMYIFHFFQVFKYLRFIKTYLMINKLLKEIEKKQKFNEIIEELKKKTQKAKLLNIQARPSKVKTMINPNLPNLNTNGNNLNNITKNINKNENGNDITTNSFINPNNKNEADNNKTNINVNTNNNNLSGIGLVHDIKSNNNLK
jgi:hypothetical protein